MRFPILNRYSGEIQFTADINCKEDEKESIKKRLAVLWALENKADLSGAYLARANLNWVDLTNADLSGANLTWAKLTWANLTNANLTWVNLINANLTNVNLTNASLINANLTWANLINANLNNVDLTNANLTNVDITNANLTNVDLTNANLINANLTWAEWIPVIKNIHKKMYDICSVDNNLNMGSWCGMKKCCGGWVCYLGGEGGAVLEGIYGTNAAASLIYMASDPTLDRLPNYYSSDEEMMTWLKVKADLEKGGLN